MINVNIYVIPIGAGYFGNSHYGFSTHPILIYSTYCSSYQNNFFKCNMNQFPNSYSQCNNYQEAGVKCERELMTLFYYTVNYCYVNLSSMY